MPFRPDDPNNGSPKAEVEDFDWLYGDKSGAPGDDATRVMPTIPRPAKPMPSASRGTPPPITPGPGGRILPPPGTPGRRGPGAPGGSGGPRVPQVRVKWKRVIALFVVVPLVAWLVFLLVVGLTAWNKIERVNAFPSGTRPAAGQGTNYLLVGSDSRRGLSAAQRRKLGLGNVAQDAGRTDTIMILHLGSGPATLLSIPRDSWVPIPGHGVGKINSAYYYGGPKLLIQTIESTTGLRISHYVSIGLGGFVQAVDAVGGVKICPKTALNDKLADLHVKAGCQIADGTTALGWARSRHAFALGDIARAEHQRTIVHEVGQKAKSVWTFILPWRFNAITGAAVTGLTIDNTMSLFNMISFARGMSAVGKTCSMPIANLNVDWDRTRALALLQYFKNDDTGKIPANLCTATGLPQ